MGRRFRIYILGSRGECAPSLTTPSLQVGTWVKSRLGTLIGYSTAPLVCLRFGLAVSHHNVNKNLAYLLSVLFGTQSRLEGLNIALWQPDSYYYTQVSRVHGYT
ncbi:hypothetical protein FRC08_003144 [Ceratobasidium sp. 394]|nr:hypothetical protein FRC08_003144 [Ceratobasidium sp. 394]